MRWHARGSRAVSACAPSSDSRNRAIDGFSQESSAARRWPGLKKAYGLPRRPSALDHGAPIGAFAERRSTSSTLTTDADRPYNLGLERRHLFFPITMPCLLSPGDLRNGYLHLGALSSLRGAFDERRLIALTPKRN